MISEQFNDIRSLNNMAFYLFIHHIYYRFRCFSGHLNGHNNYFLVQSDVQSIRCRPAASYPPSASAPGSSRGTASIRPWRWRLQRREGRRLWSGECAAGRRGAQGGREDDVAEWLSPFPIDSDWWYVQRLDDTYRGNELSPRGQKRSPG